MSEVLVFPGCDVFDSVELRMQAVRIPQVLSVLKEAEKFLEEMGITEISLINFFLYENRLFRQDQDLRRLVSSLVQYGFYQRFMRHRESQWDYVTGPIESFSALQMIVDSLSLYDWISGNSWVQRQLQSKVIPISSGVNGSDSSVQGKSSLSIPLISGAQTIAPPLVSGFRESPISIFVKNSVASESVTSPTRRYTETVTGHETMESAVQELVDHYGASRFVVIGPGYDLRASLTNESLRELVEFVDSTTFDPLLAWVPQAVTLIHKEVLH